MLAKSGLRESPQQRVQVASPVPAPVRVLLVDDSVVVRSVLRAALSPTVQLADPACRVEICGVARDGIECLDAVRNLKPDILVLDIEMPRMDGLTALTHLKQIAPHLPVIMFSSHTAQGAQATLDALSRGAADYVTKPTTQANADASIAELRRQLLPKIAELAQSSKRKLRQLQPAAGVSRLDIIARSFPMAALPMKIAPIKAIAIGVSTGGPAVLEQLLSRLPADFPVPLLIVQHMPAIFTEMLAHRLNAICPLHVREAVEGELLRAGDVWIAKGDWHMVLKSRGRCCEVSMHLEQGPQENYCRPAVDKLFHSAVEVYGAGVMGVILTGMGNDGAAGALAMQRSGGLVLAQDEATSAVWGMPRRAVECGAVYKCLGPESIAAELVRRVMHAEENDAV